LHFKCGEVDKIKPIKIGVIKAYLKKEIKEILRDNTLWYLYLVPFVVFILFGSGIKLTLEHVKTAVLDYDNSKHSLELISKLSHNRYFEVETFHRGEGKLYQKLKEGKYLALVVIPSGFERRFLKRDTGEVLVYIDSSYPFRGSTAEGYFESFFLNAFSGKVKPKIEINHRYLFNQAMKDTYAIVPGLFGMLLLMIPAMVSSLLIVREKERGTIFNFYNSPIGKFEFILVKSIPAVVLNFLTVFPLLLLALYLFHLLFKGSLLLFLIATLLYITIGVGIGIIISALVSNQVTALIVSAIVTILPSFLYSGILMPVSSMEGFSYIEAHLLPVYYFNLISYDSFLSGFGLHVEEIRISLLILSVYAITLPLIGTLLLKKHL
jgi:ABC-2 type transport system permease protein